MRSGGDSVANKGHNAEKENGNKVNNSNVVTVSKLLVVKKLQPSEIQESRSKGLWFFW